MNIRTIPDKKLDEILKKSTDERFSWDPNKIKIKGALYYRESIVTEDGTKSTAASLIKKESYFDFSFMEDIYRRMDNPNAPDYLPALRYARPQGKGTRTHAHRFEFDLHSAYPHILNYEELPIDGTLYDTEQPDGMNFYTYRGEFLKDGSLITDDMKNYIIERNLGECRFEFATDKRRGSKMGEKLIAMVYKNQKTKAQAKDVHYGFFQKKYISYDRESDCYVRNPKNTHELLMIAIMSQLCYIMVTVRDIINNHSGLFITDAYKWDADDIDLPYIIEEMKRILPNYDYRIRDYYKEGHVVYKSYPDLPEAPKSHHKKKV